MKKRILLLHVSLTAILFINQARAQSGWNTVPSGSGPITTNSNTTEVTLDCDLLFNSSPGAIRAVRGETPSGYMQVYTGHTGDDGPGLFMYGNGWSSPSYGSKGLVEFWSTGDNSFQNYDPAFMLTHYNSDPSSQTWTSLLRINKNGFAGLGTNPSTDPTLENRLSIAGNIEMKSPWSSLPYADRSIRCDHQESRLGIFGGINEFNGAFIKLSGDRHEADEHGVATKGSMAFVANADLNEDEAEQAFTFTTYEGGPYWTTHMVMRKDGKLIIGSDNIYNFYRNGKTERIPDGYKLYVEDGILTEKLKVANRTDYINWSDFVFDDGYELMPLHKLESFISKNKHLPEIPTADDVRKEGIDVASMDAKLLQKIEELTLYVIKQQKEIDALKQQMKHK